MNTPLVSSTSPRIAVAGGELAWVTEREHDLASWLDEVDLELHEQVICGANSGEYKEIQPSQRAVGF